MSILLSGYLPGDEHNGVGALEARLLAEPDLDLTIVGVIEQHTITMRRRAPEEDPTLTLRWRSIEPVQGNAAARVLALLAEARADRLGADELAGISEQAEAARTETRARGRGRRRGSLSPVPAQ